MRLRIWPRHVIAAILVASSMVTLAGCATVPRNALPVELADTARVEDFGRVRIWGDASIKQIDDIVAQEAPEIQRRLLARIRAGGEPTTDYLAISGGGEDGAFGAGLLSGWSKAGSRPQFDLVTGISAGALIAPFAYLGPRHDRELKEIFSKYTPDQIYTSSILPGLFGGPALADSDPLARLIAHYVDRRFLNEIASERKKGRILLIGTTNLDAQRPVLWDMGRIAMSRSPEAVALFQRILLASASIPGVFPPVHISVHADGHAYEEMHVDGGVTQQVFLLPSRLMFGELDRAVGMKVDRRLFIIRNGKVTPEWKAVAADALSITGRSVSTLIKSQGIGDLYRLRYIAVRDGLDYNLATIPGSFDREAPVPFDRKYMQALFEVGFNLGASGYNWRKAPPGFEASDTRSDASVGRPSTVQIAN